MACKAMCDSVTVFVESLQSVMHKIMANEADVEAIGSKRCLKYAAFAKECRRPTSRAVPKERSHVNNFQCLRNHITLPYDSGGRHWPI